MNILNEKYEILDYDFNRIDIVDNWFTRPEIEDLSSIFLTKQRTSSIKLLVVHHDAIHHESVNYTPIIDILKYHTQEKNFETIAYHYYIDVYGTIYKLHNEIDLTYHAASVNNISLGICLQGDFNTDYPTTKQYQALIKLLKKLTKDLRLEHTAITGHNRVGDTDCPGSNIDIELIQKNVYNHHILKQLYKKFKNKVN